MILILTGCIHASPNTPYLTIKAPSEREQQYIESIRWAVEDTLFEKVLFCENSAHCFDTPAFQALTRLAQQKGKQLELLSFQGDTRMVEQRGKGYGEGEILKYALQNSVLLRDEPYFFKLTGRLKVQNVNDILSKISLDRDYFLYLFPLSQCFDTKFYGIRKEVFQQQLLQEYLRVDDFHALELEKCYWQKLTRYEKTAAWPLYPQYAGITGSGGHDLSKLPHQALFNTLCKWRLYNNLLVFTCVRLLLRGRKS